MNPLPSTPHSRSGILTIRHQKMPIDEEHQSGMELVVPCRKLQQVPGMPLSIELRGSATRGR